MKIQVLFYLCSLIFLISSSPSTFHSNSTDLMRPNASKVSDEERAINLAVKNAYAVISFKEGETPDYEAIRSIFIDGASLHNFRDGSLSSSKIDDFILDFKATVSSGNLPSFNEIELGGKTEHFGKIAHRISSYASYIENPQDIVERGVNSFQLLKVDGKWLISSLVWDVESADLSIPSKYLDDKSK